MIERKIANYFEVVDLVDRVFPPKSEIDYTTLKPRDLVDRFNEEVEKSGFYWEESLLVNVRKGIEECFEHVYGRTSNFVGISDEKQIDQNDYYIQNQLSAAKLFVIRKLAKEKDLIVEGFVDTRRFAQIDELRPRLTRDNIKKYVEEVLTVTCEEGGRLSLDSGVIAADILLHFGVQTRSEYRYEKIHDQITGFIDHIRYDSNDLYGPLHEGMYYDRAVMNKEKYNSKFYEYVHRITEAIYALIKDALDRTEVREARFAEQRRKKEEQEKSLKPIEEPKKEAPKTVEQFIGETFGEPKKEEPIEEPKKEEPKTVEQFIGEMYGEPKKEEPSATPKVVTVSELAATKARYEEVQALMAENVQLMEELERLSKQIDEVQTRLNKNNDIIRKRLSFPQ